MPLTSDVAFARGLDHFGEVIERVGDDDWDRPTPCDGWSALDVLGHLGTSVRFGVAALQGRELERPTPARPADLVDAPPRQWWEQTAEEARRSLDGADLSLVMETPMGPRTVAERLAFPAIDLYVHAWDIGKAVGRQVLVPTDVIEFAHAALDLIPPVMMRSSGRFAPEASAPDDATPTEVFIAWTGRVPR